MDQIYLSKKLNQAEQKDVILDSLLEIFYEEKIEELSFELVAQKAKLTVTEVQNNYNTLNEITGTLAKRSISKLSREAGELSKQKGFTTLQKLLSNDIHFFFRVETDKKLIDEDTKITDHRDAIDLFHNYFNTDMPKNYEAFFTNNLALLPEGSVDVKFYAQFISHSLKFFNMETLKSFESTSEGRKTATENIIASLFGRDDIELEKF